MLIYDMYHTHWKPLTPGWSKPDPKCLIDFPIVAPNTLIGLEIEAENFSGFPVVPEVKNHIETVWHEKAEGSLRHRGIEFVTGAIQGAQIGDALTLLHLMNNSGNLIYNDLTGLHVHLNIRPWSVDQIVNLVLLYILFEDSLFRISGKRQNSIYCLPARTSWSGLPDLINTGNLKASVLLSNKYMGFNYAAIKKYGTVEFRHSQGNKEISYILHWINTLLRLHSAAELWNTLELKDTIFKLNTNSEYFMFAKDTFKEEIDWLDCSGLKNEMREGVAVLKEWQINSHMTSKKILDQTRKPKIKKSPVLVVEPPIAFNLLFPENNKAPMFVRR